MMTPLPGNRNVRILPTDANRGLYFDKFFNQWDGGFSDISNSSGKSTWIKNCTGTLKDCKAERINQLATALDGQTTNLTTTGPFITGMGLSNPIENGFLWHHTLGVPYLPGSSVKGMMRAWLTEWCEEEGIADNLFGRNDKHVRGASAGSLIVFDALPVGHLVLQEEVITPHTGDWRITENPQDSPPADWVSPVPISFLVVKEGAEFQFAMAWRKGVEGVTLDDAFGYLQDALEWIGAGAKTAVGFGRFLSEEAAEKQQAAQREQKAQAQKAALEAQENWQPVVGGRVHWADSGEDVTVKSIDGSNAVVLFDDGEDDNVPLSDLSKSK